MKKLSKRLRRRSKTKKSSNSCKSPIKNFNQKGGDPCISDEYKNYLLITNTYMIGAMHHDLKTIIKYVERLNPKAVDEAIHAEMAYTAYYLKIVEEGENYNKEIFDDGLYEMKMKKEEREENEELINELKTVLLKATSLSDIGVIVGHIRNILHEYRHIRLSFDYDDEIDSNTREKFQNVEKILILYSYTYNKCGITVDTSYKFRYDKDLEENFIKLNSNGDYIIPTFTDHKFALKEYFTLREDSARGNKILELLDVIVNNAKKGLFHI